MSRKIQTEKAIEWLEKEIASDPNHPTDVYLRRDIARLREDLKEIENDIRINT